MPPSGYCVVLIVALAGGCLGRSWRQAASNFVGEGTNDLTVSILQSDVEEARNFVFSPLGYSAILAILAEGARESTRNQLVTALRLPEDTFAVRNTYKNLLAGMRERGVLNKPEFKTWFYVYKNFSVEDSYKEILAENYLTEVKSIEREWEEYSPTDEPEDLIAEEKKKGALEQEAPPEKEEAPPKEVAPSRKEDESPGGSPGKDHPKEEPEPAEVNPSGELGKVKEEETEEKKGEESKESIGGPNGEESALQEKGQKRKAGGAKKKEKGRSVWRFMFGKAVEGGQATRDTMTALSANRLCSVVKSETEKNPKSRMLIFNGLYFRGNWSVPFKSHMDWSFYKMASEKKQVPVMEAIGDFDVGEIPDLDAKAIELPYQGERYSLLVLLPNSRDGLAKLTSDLTGYSFRNIDKHLSKREVQVCLPKFKFYTISHPKKALIKSGVSDIFNEDADLSGITGKKGLYLDDLVQLVTLEVDEGDGQANFITATTLLGRNSVGKFCADHPFLFFLRDRIDNLVVVAGKVTDPSNVN